MKISVSLRAVGAITPSSGCSDSDERDTEALCRSHGPSSMTVVPPASLFASGSYISVSPQ